MRSAKSLRGPKPFPESRGSEERATQPPGSPIEGEVPSLPIARLATSRSIRNPRGAPNSTLFARVGAVALLLSGAGLAGSLTSVAGCENTTAAAMERGPVIRNYVEKLAEPWVAAFDRAAASHATAVRAMADKPSEETLSAAQATFAETFLAYKRVEAILVGPGDSLTLSSMFQYPVTVTAVEAELTKSDDITDGYVETLGAQKKGLAALEYLLFDPAGKAAVLTKFTATETGARRRQYLAALATNFSSKTAALKKDWSLAIVGSFAQDMSVAGGASKNFPLQKSALDAIVNRQIGQLELVYSTRIGKPMGKATSGVVQPELEEARFSDLSLSALRASLVALHESYVGTEGKGVASLVAATDNALDDRVRKSFEDAVAAVDKIPNPFRTALSSANPSLEEAFQKIRVLRRTMSAEVASNLGVTLKFSDSDGD